MKISLKRLTAYVLILTMSFNMALISGCNKPEDDDEDILDLTYLTGGQNEESESGEETEEIEKDFIISQCDLPDYEWQKSISFPDDNGYTDDTLAMNSIAGFRTYKGQGELYVTLSSDVQSFKIYINHEKVNVNGLMPGCTYKIDFSDYSVTGENEIQVSTISPSSATIAVNIPYPVIVEGTPEDVGMSSDSFELIEEILKEDVEHGFPSAQMAVIKDGVLIYNNAYGYANRYELGAGVNTDTLYDLASNTKMYSAAYAIQKLVTDGELTMDTKISDILGAEFYNSTLDICYSGYEDYYKKGQDANREWKANITIRDVMSHKAGFPASPAYQRQIYDQAAQSSKTTVENVLYAGSDGSFDTRNNTYRMICKAPLMYKPGDKVLYSDVDYMILAFCIERITGQRLDEYMANEFYKPMGLDHITFRPLDNGFEKGDCAATEPYGNTRGGTEFFEGVRTETIQGEVHDEMSYYTMAGVSGHAGLFANAEDLAKLASVMLMGGYGDKKFFSEDVMDAFMAPSSNTLSNWGVGWYREGDNRRAYYFGELSSNDTIGHQGWTGTITMIDPDNDLVIVYLTNKINTEITDTDYNNNKFDGSWYTSATLGFATELVYEGLNPAEEENEALDDLLCDMVVSKFKLVDKETENFKSKSAMKTPVDENHAVVKAAYSVLEAMITRVDEADEAQADDYYHYAVTVLDLLNEDRDLNEMKKLYNESSAAKKYFDERNYVLTEEEPE